MPNSYTRTSIIELSDSERAELNSMARSRSLPTALTLRARMVLACEGADTPRNAGLWVRLETQ